MNLVTLHIGHFIPGGHALIAQCGLAYKNFNYNLRIGGGRSVPVFIKAFYDSKGGHFYGVAAGAAFFAHRCKEVAGQIGCGFSFEVTAVFQQLNPVAAGIFHRSPANHAGIAPRWLADLGQLDFADIRVGFFGNGSVEVNSHVT